METEKKRQIRESIKNSTIPEELKVLYLLATATEIMSQQTYRRIKSVFARHGFNVKDNEMLSGLNQYCKFIKQASFQFFERIDPHVLNATWGASLNDDGTGQGNPNAVDSFNEDANEVIQLILLYIDRTVRNSENSSVVFETLKNLSSCGVFNESDIKKYHLNVQ